MAEMKLEELLARMEALEKQLKDLDDEVHHVEDGEVVCLPGFNECKIVPKEEK